MVVLISGSCQKSWWVGWRSGVGSAIHILLRMRVRSRSVPREGLLDLDRRSLLLELLLHVLGLGLGHLLLDRLRRAVDEVLGLLQAEPRELAHDLDDLDLLVAGRSEDDVELRLLLRGA